MKRLLPYSAAELEGEFPTIYTRFLSYFRKILIVCCRCKVMVECWSHDPYSRPHMALAHKLMESSIMTNKYDKSHVRLYSN